MVAKGYKSPSTMGLCISRLTKPEHSGSIGLEQAVKNKQRSALELPVVGNLIQ